MKKGLYFLILFKIFSISLICDEKDTLKTLEVLPKITILEFGADNCYSCKKMKKVLNEIKFEFGDSVRVEFIDFNEPRNHRIIKKYFIKEIPAQIFLDEENKIFYRHTGLLRKKNIQQKIKEKLNKI